MTFITYGLTGHDLSAGNIFAALQLFNIIKYPLQQMGMQLSAVMDCLSALGKPNSADSAELLTVKNASRICLRSVHSPIWRQGSTVADTSRLTNWPST